MEDEERTRELKKSGFESKWMDELSKALIVASPVGIYIAQDGEFKLTSPRFQAITGYSEDELVGMDPMRLVLPEDRETVRKNAVKMLKKRRSSPYEFRIITKSKETRWIVETVARIQYQGKRAILGSSMDISELKHTRELLRESQERYQMLIQQSVEAIYLFDPETKKVLEANPSFLNLLGYREEELAELIIYDFIDHDRKSVDSYIEHILRTGAIRIEDRKWRCKDGTLIDIHLTSNKIQHKGKEVIFVVARDVTERRRAERELRENRKLLNNILTASPVGIGMIEEEELKWANEAMLRFFGLESEEEYIGKHVKRIYPSKEEYERVRKAIYSKLRRGEPAEIDTKFKRKDGSLFDGHLKVSPFDPAKPLKKVIVTVSDITWRKEAEAALAAEKERLAVTLRSIGDGVICTDEKGIIALMNRMAEELTGWKEKEAIGRPLSDVFYIINEKTRKRCENPVDKVLESGGIVGLANHTVLVSRDGTERILADSGAPIRDKDGKIFGVVLVFRDITKKQKMEEEIQKIDRLESIGVLAGGIAHDFNNILMAILGNIALAKIYARPGDKILKRLEEAEKASLRAKNLTQQMLTFSKGGAPVKKSVLIHELIKDSISFALSGSNVHCEFSLPGDLWPVKVDKGQIGQAINNLAINADQAMPAGGTIKVKAENTKISEENNLPLKTGEYVKITIEDQGVGIPKEHLPKIFDPYFTTKQKGSGLGLATAYSIIKRHDGYINAESELGAGTRFFIYLPASRREISAEMTKEEGPIFGKGKVLLMDDEEVVREVAGEMLNYLGYEVKFAREGTEAISLYKKAKEAGEPFDVVILDLTIPGGMGGKEAIEKLLGVDPEVKVIVSSGYSNDPIMADFRRYGFKGVVAKPYKLEELSKELHRIIVSK